MSESSSIDLARVLAGFQRAISGESIIGEKLKKGERREVVVFFLDIVGFSTLTEKLSDPEQVYSIISGLFSAFSQIIRHHGGKVEKFIGDAIMAAWGTERTSENDSEKAVLAGIEIIEALAQINTILAERKIELQARIGINAGLVVFIPDPENPNGWSITGDSVNSAQRLESNALPGTILVSASVRERAGEAFLYEDKGEVIFKGKSIPIHTFRITAKGTGRKKPWERVEIVKRSPIVGRERELTWLREIHNREPEKNWRGGAKHFVTGIKGEPGLGKSRLIHEFTKDTNSIVLKGQTLAFAQPPLWVWSTILRDYFIVPENDTSARNRIEEAVDKIVNGIPEADSEELKKRLPFFYRMLSIPFNREQTTPLDDQTRQVETFLAMKYLLQALAYCSRLIVLLEDTHWLDSSSEKMLSFLFENCETNNPILFICTYRPEGTLPKVHPSYADAAEWELHPIGETDCRKLIRSMLSGDLPENAEHFIVQRADGNPFFVEEVVLSLIARGILQQNEARWVLLRPLTDAEVPLTLNALVLSRIDQLEPILKEVVRRASVVGREFFLDTLLRINQKLGDIEQTGEHLDELERNALLLELPDSDPLAYLFKHAVTRDVAYSTILHRNRKILHGVTAAVMEELYGTSETYSPIILDHLLKAEAEIEKIITWWQRTQKHCKSQQQIRELVDWSERVAQRIRTEPVSEQRDEVLFTVLERLSISYGELGNVPKNEETLTAMEQLVDRYQWLDHKWEWIIQLANCFMLQGKADEAYSIVQKAFTELPIPDSPEKLAKITNIKGNVSLHKNLLTEAEACFREVIRLADGVDNRLSVLGHNNLGVVLNSTGRTVESIEEYQKAIEGSTANQTPVFFINLCEALAAVGRVEEARAGLLDAAKITRDRGLKLSEADAYRYLGDIDFEREEWQSALDYFHNASILYKESNASSDDTYVLCRLGHVHLEHGETSEAQAIIDELTLIGNKNPDFIDPKQVTGLQDAMKQFSGNR